MRSDAAVLGAFVVVTPQMPKPRVTASVETSATASEVAAAMSSRE
jgi:hypothetical protein